MIKLVKKGEGKKLLIIDHVVVNKVCPEDTANAYALAEIIVPPGSSPPLHKHAPQETFYVLEGTFSFSTMDEGNYKEMRAEVGDVVHVPANEIHTFTNVGTGVGRLLGLVAPTGLEKFFDSIGKPYVDGPIKAKKPSIFQMVKIGVLAKKFGITFVRAKRK